MKRRAMALIVALAVLALTPGLALAIRYVDQQNLVQDTGVQSGAIYAQTFTVGRYGPLRAASLYLHTTGAVNVSFSIEDTVGSPPVPKDGALVTGNQVVNTLEGPEVQFGLSANPILTVGHVYAMVFYIASSTTDIYGSTADVYSRGRALTLHNLAWVPLPSVYSGGPADFAFITYEDPADPTPTPVPAPTRTPTRTPTAAPTLAPTLTPPLAPAATETTADISLATSAIGGATAALAPGASGTPAAALPGSGRNDPTDMTIPIVVGLIVALLLLGGGFAFLLVRRRRNVADRP